MQPRYLVIGQGSMGKRRVRCLLANGAPAEVITVFDARADRIQEARDKYGVASTSDVLSTMGDPGMSAVFVSVPGFMHLHYCLAAARAGRNWFCEVPLAVATDGLAELKALTRAQGLVGAPGCQVLFHPLGKALKEWSVGPQGGAILAGSYTFGSYLPEWHPYEDYRKFYAANWAMGGGNLDVIAQELLWVRWVVDRRITAVSCRTSRTSALDLAEDTPDHQELIVEFEGGAMLSAHFDLIDRSHERTVRLVTGQSTVKWCTLDSKLQIFESSVQAWRQIGEPQGFQYETCYHEEIGRFLGCVAKGEPWPVTLEMAEEIVRLLRALALSGREKRTVALSEVAP